MPATRRLVGLDAARGLACVSMLVAHLCPVGGPFLVSEYLTAPLFAVIIGVSMGVVLTERQPTAVTFLRDNVQRGLVLIALGVLLQQVYAQIDVVLPYLGLLVIVMAPLALLLHRRPALTLGLAAAGAAVGPVALERARLALDQNYDSWPPWWEDVVQWVAAGESYRLVSFLPMALGGLALATVLRRATRPREGYAVAGALLVASVAAYLVGRTTPDGAAPYSGTTAEVVGATLLATGAVIASFLALDLARRFGVGRVLNPLLSTGRLALTAYTLQILFLAAAAADRGPVRDDSWLVLGSTTFVVVGGCWLFERSLGTGPLEWVMHRLRPSSEPLAATAPVSGRSAGSR
jgi:uncharacterized membrane protein